MARQVQFRRGTTIEHSTFTGVEAEVTVDTDKKTLVVHDGTTAGGIEMSKKVTLDAHLADNATGWIPSADTWTYASATTFTISGDKRAVYQKGDKFKLTSNSVVLYGYIVGVSYSAPNTTITVVGNTLTNYPYTNCYYSKEDNPQGFPHWFAWTPTATWTAGTPGGTTYTLAQFCINGNKEYFAFDFIAADGNGATAVEITLPVSPKAIGGYSIPIASMQKVNATYSNPLAFVSDSGGKVYFRAFATCTDNQAMELSFSGSCEI